MTTLKLYQFILFLLLFLFNSQLFSQENPRIAEEIIKAPPVQFINRTNRVAPNFIRQQEVQEGRNLAVLVQKNQKAERNNVIIIRYFDPSIEKYGADLFSITQKANFGHVTQIQRILIGYLEKSFGYNPNQSVVLSEMLLYYNVYLRNNTKQIQETYEQKILENLNINNAGLDRNYRNWAGKTNMFIPLKKNVVRPEKTDLDRKELQEVIEKDKNIPQEKKEEFKKIDEQIQKQDEKKLDQKIEEIKKQEQEIKKVEEQLKKEEQSIKTEMQDTNRKLEELRKDPEKNKEEIKQQEQKVDELKKQEQKIEEQKNQIQQQQEKIQQDKKEAEQQKQDIKNNQTDTTRKEEVKQENQQEQKQPATKQEQTIQQLEKEKEELKKELEKKEQQSENVIGEKIVFLKVLRYIEQGHYNNELWMIDTAKDDILFRSPFNNICGKSFLTIDKTGIIIVGYEGDKHDNDHKLYLLDPETLVAKIKSDANVFWNSQLIFRDQVIYAIAKEGDKFYLAKFDNNLKIKEKSSSDINPNSEITFFKDKIYVTGPIKNNQYTIQVYKREGLQLLKTIESGAGTVFNK